MERTRRRFALYTRKIFLFCSLLACTPNVSSFQGRRVAGRTIRKHSLIIGSYEKGLHYQRRNHVASFRDQNQGVEEEFVVLNLDETPSRGLRRWLSRRTWTEAIRVDRKQAAQLGMSFMLTYNFVSNINGSIFLSLAWYISSVRSGLSPLAAGQWKALLGTYAGLYVFITLLRPLRLALAVAMTKRVANVLEQTQYRFNCPKPVAAGMVLSAMLSFWAVFVSCGITLASTLAGVPFWTGMQGGLV